MSDLRVNSNQTGYRCSSWSLIPVYTCTLTDQHRAMNFSLQMVPSVDQAGNNPQFPISQLKLNVYVALSSATQEATSTYIWLCCLMKDLDLEDRWMPRPPSTCMKATK